METANNVLKSVNGDKNGFINTVFAFNDDSKCEMLNIVQYSVLALIPSIAILKAIKNISPEDDDSKGSIEITIEVLLQLSFMVLAMYFTNKAIKYVPTYSGTDYVTIGDSTIFLLPFVILLFAMQTKIGAKTNILYERALVAVHGEPDENIRVNTGKNGVRISQPLAGQHNPSQSDTLDMSHLLPNNTGMTTQMPNAGRMQPQQSPDFNTMHASQNTPMPGADMPGMSEPIASNDFGGGFSNW
jgi:hypothetical protein